MIKTSIDQAAETFVNSGRILLQSRALDAAAQLFLRAQLLEPRKLAAVVNHAICLKNKREGLCLLTRALALSPSVPAVHANIGTWFSRTSNCSAVLRSFRRLALLAPTDIRAYNGLANAWLIGVSQNGQICGGQESVIGCLRRIGVLTPDNWEAQIMRAQILMRANQVNEAWAIIEPLLFNSNLQTQALVLERMRPNFLVLLAQEVCENEQKTRAADCFDLVLQHYPHDLLATKVKARHLRLQGEYEVSSDLFRSVIIQDPQDLIGIQGFKECLLKMGALGSADRCFYQLNNLKPSDFLSRVADWSVTSFHAGKVELSKKLSLRSILSSPGELLGYHNLCGLLLGERRSELAGRMVKYAEYFGQTSKTFLHKGVISLRRNELADAKRFFVQAIDIEPEMVDARFNISLMHLKAGEVEAGLQEFDLRWQRPYIEKLYEMHPTPDLDIPVWQGTDLEGKRIYVRGEQGIGDEIWFSSALEPLINSGAHITLECNPKLVSLLQRSFPSVDVQGFGVRRMPQAQNFDFQIPVGSILQYIYKRGYTVPTNYLKPDPNLVAKLRRLYSKNEQTKVVGLSWRSLKGKKRYSFQAPLETWTSIKNLQNCTFISLQYGETEQEIAAFAEKTGIHILQDPAIDTYNNVDGVAAQIKASDAVISIANFTIMLAHATGTPSWAALRPFQDDWRFQNHGKKSFWLPACKQFWPSKSPDWRATISQIGVDIKQQFSER